MRLRNRVQISEKEQAFVFVCATALRCLSAVTCIHIVLHPHPIPDRAEIIAEMEVSSWLNARDDTHDLRCFLLRKSGNALTVNSADSKGNAEIDDRRRPDERHKRA